VKEHRKQKVLSRYIDGELQGTKSSRMTADLESDASMREVQAEYSAIGDRLRDLETPEAPPVEKMWSDIQRDIRLGTNPGEDATAFGSRLRWAGGTVATVLALMMVWIVMQSGFFGSEAYAAAAEVEWVETDVPNASTMVYLDDDTGMTVIWILEQEEGAANAGS
jgi:anti-sigma factor RsiW